MKVYKEGLREMYDLYKGSDADVEYPLYRKILKTYYSKVIDAIIFDNLEYKFQYVGNIYITKVKPKIKLNDDGSIKPTLPIDWVNTKRFKKLIYHRNDNRYGYVFRIKWDKAGAKGSSLFKFYPERYNFKRYLSSLLLDEDVKIDAPVQTDAYYNSRI